MIYKELAEQAYEEYFRRVDGDEGQKDLLNEIVSKIAQEKELNYEEVSRVCQYLNTKIFLKLYKSTNDKTIEFGIADPGSIRLVKEPEERIQEFSDEDFMVMPRQRVELPTINFKELMALKHKLENKLDDANAFLREEKPHIVRRLATRLGNEDPQVVVIAVKSVNGTEPLLKSAAAKAGVNLDGIKCTLNPQEFEIDYSDGLLKKIAEYSKMEKERDELEKMAIGLSSVTNTIFGVNQLAGMGRSTSEAKKTILSNEPIKQEFNTINMPRKAPVGDTGYLRGHSQHE